MPTVKDNINKYMFEIYEDYHNMPQWMKDQNVFGDRTDYINGNKDYRNKPYGNDLVNDIFNNISDMDTFQNKIYETPLFTLKIYSDHNQVVDPNTGHNYSFLRAIYTLKK